MSESYLLREQELIKLNHELDLKNKQLQTRISNKTKVKQQKRQVTCEKRIDDPVVIKKNEEKKFHCAKSSPIKINKESQLESKYFNKNSIENLSIENEFNECSTSVTDSNVEISPRKINTSTNKLSSCTGTKIGKSSTINIIPDKLFKKNISTEGLIRFLKAKVTVLQNELELCIEDNQKKTEELNTSIEHQRQIEIQRDQIITKNNSLQLNCKKIDEKNENLEGKLKEREIEVIHLKKELDNIKREFKKLTQYNINIERRYTKIQEDLENTKNNLNSSQQIEREIREKSRLDSEALEKEIKMLRKQRVDLITAYKKQLILLDNLKRQNLCLEQAKLVDFAEKEFIKILDWNKEQKR